MLDNEKGDDLIEFFGKSWNRLLGFSVYGNEESEMIGAGSRSEMAGT